ncbi:MAG: diaminopimelate decarboxylase [Bacteroidia bacterium]
MTIPLHIPREALLQAANDFGTPLYIYNGEKILQQFERLTNAFSGIPFKVKYACKANSNINILKLLKNAGCGLDCVSIQEVKLGLLAGYLADEILFTPNSVSIDEIAEAVEIGVHINIDALVILEQFGHRFGNTVPVCVRINPHVLAGGNTHIQTGHIDSKFGISIHQMRHLHRIIQNLNIRVEGIHMHSGSDIKDADAFLRGFEILLETAHDFKDLKYVDFGSGFKVAYKEDDITTDVEAVGARVSNRFKAFCKEYGRELELWCEPGKFLVSECGYFLVRTNLVKHTVSTIFAGVNSGLNHLIRPMMYESYHHIINISNPDGPQRIYSVVGNICETDTFGWDRMINEIHEGDILLMYNAGAYGFSMSSNYNSRLKPAEVLWLNGRFQLIRKREEFNNLLVNQVEAEI